VAPFPFLMWGVAFTACIVFSFSLSSTMHVEEDHVSNGH
jgi:hypothetical protein